MIDAYAHLDMSVADPLADLRARMASASVNRALVVETWGKDNTAVLERLSDISQSEFRIALCYRSKEGIPLPQVVERHLHRGHAHQLGMGRRRRSPSDRRRHRVLAQERIC